VTAAQPEDTAPPVAPAVVAATWKTIDVSTDWLPEPLGAAIAWGRDVSYRDVDCVERWVGDAWQLLGISQRGRVHAHEGTHREDAMALMEGAHGFVLAAADGAGSSRWSRVASTLVCRHVVHAAETLVRHGVPSGDAAHRLRDALSRAVCGASDELQRAASTAGGASRDVRTTVLAVIVVDGWLAALQVGDGAIVTVARDGQVARLGTGDAGHYSGEVVAFVPEVDADAIAARIVVRPIARSPDDHPEAILLLTDGIEDPFYPVERRGTEIARQLYHGVATPAEGFRAQAVHGPIVGSAEAQQRLRQWIDFERRGENDDRTLVGAFRLPPAFLG